MLVWRTVQSYSGREEKHGDWVVRIGSMKNCIAGRTCLQKTMVVARFRVVEICRCQVGHGTGRRGRLGVGGCSDRRGLGQREHWMGVKGGLGAE